MGRLPQNRGGYAHQVDERVGRQSCLERSDKKIRELLRNLYLCGGRLRTAAFFGFYKPFTLPSIVY